VRRNRPLKKGEEGKHMLLSGISEVKFKILNTQLLFTHPSVEHRPFLQYGNDDRNKLSDMKTAEHKHGSFSASGKTKVSKASDAEGH
jgi:hypothetical protein